MGAKRHCYGRQFRQPKKPAPRRCRDRPLSQCRPRLKRGEAPGRRSRPAQGKPPPGTYPAGLTSATRIQPRGSKGRSPLHKKPKTSPFPGGEGGRGDRGKQLLLRQANPATEKASPPADAATALFPNAAHGSSEGVPERRPPPRTGQAPAGYLPRRLNQCRPGSAPGDARGEAPCIRKLKKPPFPPGRGVRGMGAKRHCYGRQIRQPKKSAPQPMPRPPSFPMPLPAQVPGHQNAAPPPRTGQPPRRAPTPQA